jgi:hypothetical protein
MTVDGGLRSYRIDGLKGMGGMQMYWPIVVNMEFNTSELNHVYCFGDRS